MSSDYLGRPLTDRSNTAVLNILKQVEPTGRDVASARIGLVITLVGQLPESNLH